MRSGSVISLSIAIVFGLVAAALMRGLIHPATTPVRNQTIVVAAQPLGFGIALTAENLREVPWPSEGMIDGAFASIAEMNKDGRRLTLASFQRNEPVLSSKITGPNQRATLSTQIDEGMRAVSIRVDEVRGVAGFVLPGDRVDVILTKGETSSPDSAGAYADVLLQNSRVLAIEQSVNERSDKPAIARAVTLELTVQQAQSVILAQGIGRLSLVLRQTGEVSTRPTGRVTAGDIAATISSGSGDRIGELEKQLADMKRATEQSNARLSESSKKFSELEQRMRDELARANTQPAIKAPAQSAKGSTVTVIRNGVKREQYSVVTEK